MTDRPDYGQAVSAPLTDAEAAALRRDLADGTVPRRKATVLADDEPAAPNPRTRAAAEQMAAERGGYTAWAELRPRIVTSEQRVAEARAEMEQAVSALRRPTGYTIGVYLPPEATEADEDAIMTLVADAVHGYEYEGQWDPFVVGHAGDLLYIEHHPDDVIDWAGHVRERWIGER